MHKRRAEVDVSDYEWRRSPVSLLPKARMTTASQTLGGVVEQVKPRLTNLSKAVAIKEERKFKRDQMMIKQKSTAVKIQACLWRQQGDRVTAVSDDLVILKM